jgi:serine protease
MLVITSIALTAPGHTLSQTEASHDEPSTVSIGQPTNQIIIKYKDSVRLSAMDFGPGSVRLQGMSAVAGESVSYFRSMFGGAHVLKLANRVPEAEVQAIADRMSNLPDVEYAEPDRILHPTFIPNDPQWSHQWGYSSTYGMNLPAAWDMTTGASSTVVAVIDTGYRPHADLAGRFVQGYDFISVLQVANDGDLRDADAQDPGDWISAADIAGDFAGWGCTVENSSWHGTHLAGTIAANTNNSTGVAGINWQAKILPVRVLGKCGGYTSDIIDGMRWAAGLSVAGVPANANPAKVLNISLGGPGACDATQQSAIDEINATGAIVVVAAGNANDSASNYNPANCNNVITVGATTVNGVRAPYSNYGSMVDVSAPGGSQGYANDPNGILSTLNAGTTIPVTDTYAYYQGTSMATPHVAGLVSLMLAISPTLDYTHTEPILKATARSFAPGSDCAVKGCGAGIIDAYAALSTLWQTPPPTQTHTQTFVPFVSVPSITVDAIVNSDFERGLIGWKEYSLHGYKVIMNSGYPNKITAHSGSWLAWIGGESSATSYVQQQITVPVGSPTLAYWQWIDSLETKCIYDFGSVLVNGKVLDSYGLCGSSNTNGWVQHTVDLSSYAGQSVLLQIRATTDSTVNSNIFVDDVSVQPSAVTGVASSANRAEISPQAISIPKQDFNR